ATPGMDSAIEATAPAEWRERLSQNIVGAQAPPTWSQVEEAHLRSALAYIQAVERQIWLLVGRALNWAAWERAFQIWDEWSRTVAGKYNEEDQYRTCCPVVAPLILFLAGWSGIS